MKSYIVINTAYISVSLKFMHDAARPWALIEINSKNEPVRVIKRYESRDKADRARNRRIKRIVERNAQ